MANALQDDIFIVSQDVLDIGWCYSQVLLPYCGAVSSFIGTVRTPNLGKDVTHLEYEGFEAMILRQMQHVAAELRENHELGKLLFAHRLGKLKPEEASIAIFISSPHRTDGLKAVALAINQLKERLPIWKLEVCTDGSRWVEGSSAGGTPL